MHPWFVGFAAGLRRDLARHQGRPLSDARREPLWRLLLDEVVYLVGRALRPPILWGWLSGALVAVIIMIAFAEGTPGPVLSLGVRMAVAAVAGLIAAVAVRRWPHRGDG